MHSYWYSTAADRDGQRSINGTRTQPAVLVGTVERHMAGNTAVARHTVQAVGMLVRRMLVAHHTPEVVVGHRKAVVVRRSHTAVVVVHRMAVGVAVRTAVVLQRLRCLV